MSDLELIGMTGSLRSGSHNRALLRACTDLLPDGASLDIVDLAPIPSYNGDLENDEDRPDPVRDLKTKLARADGLLIATPEYNHGIPGVLKNALDWASRPAFASPMAGLPVGMMSASPAKGGGVRAQQQLKLVLLGMVSEVFPHPGVAVGHSGDKFDDDMRLTDESTRDFVRDFLSDFVSWARERSADG